MDDTPTTIFENNQGCITLAKNPAYHAKTKHIDIQHHFIWEKVEDKEIDLVYCKTEDMIADMLMKPVTRDKLQKFCNRLGLRLWIKSGSVENTVSIILVELHIF